MSQAEQPAATTSDPLTSNVKSCVALLMVTDMERSLAFYVDGLGFKITNRWLPDGHLRWCWMQLGTAALMLQHAMPATLEKLAANGKLGNGIGLNFQCDDALAIYRQAKERGIAGREPQVGNFNWEVSLRDPDGYSIHFCSPTDLPEETLLSEIEK
jgi:catechol 2,3-dioxygenase-like lactoylglutathione lyase family enzyme